MDDPAATFLTPADLIACGLRLPTPDKRPQAVPPDTRGAIFGQPISEGYRRADMTTEATAEFLESFRGDLHGWLSESEARCFKSSDPRKGNPCARGMLIFEDGTAYLPTISGTDEAPLPQLLIDLGSPVTRPAWRDLVREVWPARHGQRLLCILTRDTKKRLWIRARVGTLGPRTPVLFHAGDQSELLLLDWPSLLDCLDVIEEVYSLGWSKTQIETSLLRASKILQVVGLARSLRLERQLFPWRGTPEFGPALLIAQKAPEVPIACEEVPRDPEESADPAPVRPDRGTTQLVLL